MFRRQLTIPVLDREKVPQNAGLAAVVDVETTGLSSRSDRIVEFAGVLFAYERHSGRVLGRVYEYASLNDPGIPIPQAATAVNGITQRMVKRKKMDERTIDALLAEAEFIVAHNATFDRGFLRQISKEAQDKAWVCSMRQINWKSLGHQSYALQKLLSSHGIRPQNAHRALEDARCTLTLLSMPDRNGHPYLKRLLPKVKDLHRTQTKDAVPQPSNMGTSNKQKKSRGLNIVWTTINK